MKIKLNTIKDINDFVSIASRYGGDIVVKQGLRLIDGKSILGIFSLNLLKPLDVVIHAENQDEKEDFYRSIERYNTNQGECPFDIA